MNVREILTRLEAGETIKHIAGKEFGYADASPLQKKLKKLGVRGMKGQPGYPGELKRLEREAPEVLDIDVKERLSKKTIKEETAPAEVKQPEKQPIVVYDDPNAPIFVRVHFLDDSKPKSRNAFTMDDEWLEWLKNKAKKEKVGQSELMTIALQDLKTKYPD